MADNPKIALAAVVHDMALGVFYDDQDSESRLQITPRIVYLDRRAEGMDGTEAAKQLAAATKAMRKRLPKQASKLWAWLQNQQQKTLLALLAVCASHTVDTVAKNGGDSGEHAAQLAAALKLDMADYWQPPRVFQPRVERADARRDWRGVRCQCQGRLRDAQENGARRCSRGEAEGLALAARTPAGNVRRGAPAPRHSASDAGAGIRGRRQPRRARPARFGFMPRGGGAQRKLALALCAPRRASASLCLVAVRRVSFARPPGVAPTTPSGFCSSRTALPSR